MLNLMSPIGYTGYGYAGLNILKHINNISNVALHPIGNPSIDNESDVSFIKTTLDNQINMNYNVPCLKIWHQFDLLQKVGSGKYFAFPFFEIDKFPDKDLYHLNFPDELIVSSEWAKNILINNQINKAIHVIPLGVDRTIFQPPENTKTTNNYVFCTIGKWEKRKAHDTIIDCFNRAFESKDNVELWLVTHNGFLNQQEEQEWLNLVQKSKLKDKIKVFPRLPSHKQVAEVISYTNCGIYISRGEGWNMELLETMSMDKPVIVSNYSAHTEYCDKENSYIVDITETEPAIDNKWFSGSANWAKIDKNQIDQTIEYMQYVYKNNISTNPSGVKTAIKYSWENTSSKIKSVCIG